VACTNDILRRPEIAQARRWADQVAGQMSGIVYPGSFVVRGAVTAFLRRENTGRSLALIWSGQPVPMIEAFSGQVRRINLDGRALQLKVCPTDAANADALRVHFPFTRPVLVGLNKSFGCGDRLGLATVGHVLACREHGDIRPVLAQQSIREMTRTARTARQVMDDAAWGVFQGGFDAPFGSDADHLKTFDDIDTSVRAGFGMFTIDPGDHVDDHADRMGPEELRQKFEALPWTSLETGPEETLARYDASISLPSGLLKFSSAQVIRAAVKYGRAISHTTAMYRRLVELRGQDGFELEMSVDETSGATTAQEHYYVAGELNRLGVRWVALAPRFVGGFEKGVDYIGELAPFRDAFTQHVEIARLLGPYKLSVHSGSDKFSIYPIIAELGGELIHVKTAGTSYLEALRVLARLDQALFREILDFAKDRYQTDRASYHVSADTTSVPKSDDLADDQLVQLLDDFHARQVLHVTFGSVMAAQTDEGSARFKDRVIRSLLEHEEAYHQTLHRHIGRHMDLLTGLQR